MASVHRTFAVTRCLGRGGFGEVYRAEMSLPSGAIVPVALKMLRRDVAPASQALQRLHDEARALAELNHPSIVRIYDLAVLDGRTTLITEVIDGEDLSDLFRSPEGVPPRVLVEIVGRIADALDGAYHAVSPALGVPLGLIHRDVKPSNIRIGRDGQVHLLDFGIARTDAGTREALTQTDVLVGSPQYMAPERYFRDVPDPSSDVFSLGAVLVEGATRQRLFDQPMPVIATLAIDRARYESHVESRLGRIPDPGVRALAARLLDYDSFSRPTAEQVASECLRLLADLEGPRVDEFCRARRWSEPKVVGGDLVGRVLMDEEIWPSRAHGPAEPVERTFPARRAATTVRQVDPSRRYVWSGAVLLGSLLFGTVAIVGSSVFALRAYSDVTGASPQRTAVAGVPAASPQVPSTASASPEASTAVVVVSAPPPVPVRLPASAPPSPEPVALSIATPPVRDDPAALPPPRPPSEPELVPELPPEPAPRPAPSGPVRVRTSVSIDGEPGVATLSANGVDFPLPGEVPPGDYRLRVARADGSREEFEVSVPATSQPHQIVCRTRMHSCR